MKTFSSSFINRHKHREKISVVALAAAMVVAVVPTLATLVFATAGCEKKSTPPAPASASGVATSPAELAKRPEHEQLMAILELAQHQRLELAQARATVRCLKYNYATDKKNQSEAYAAAEAELREMASKFKAAQAAANKDGTSRPIFIEHDGVTYSEPNYRLLVAQKLNAKTSLSGRVARLDTHHVRYDDNLQTISLKLDALGAREREVRANIGELLRGREVTGLKDLLKDVDGTDVAAITKAVAEMQDRPTLLDADAGPSSPATVADLAGADALLNAK